MTKGFKSCARKLLSVSFLGVQECFVEELSVVWEIQADGLGKMRRVDGNLNEHIESFDSSLIDRNYTRNNGQVAAKRTDRGARTQATVAIMHKHIAAECDCRVIVYAASSVCDIAHDHSQSRGKSMTMVKLDTLNRW